MGLFDGVPVNHSSGEEYDDVKVEWVNLSEIRPKPTEDDPYILEGTLAGRTTRAGQYGEQDLLFLDVGGIRYGISGHSKMFREEVAAADPQKGEAVGFRYSGKVKMKNGNSYHFVEWMTDHKTERTAPAKAEKIPF